VSPATNRVKRYRVIVRRTAAPPRRRRGAVREEAVVQGMLILARVDAQAGEAGEGKDPAAGPGDAPRSWLPRMGTRRRPGGGAFPGPREDVARLRAVAPGQAKAPPRRVAGAGLFMPNGLRRYGMTVLPPPMSPSPGTPPPVASVSSVRRGSRSMLGDSHGRRADAAGCGREELALFMACNSGGTERLRGGGRRRLAQG